MASLIFALACLAHASHAGRQYTSSGLAQDTQQAQKHTLTIAKDASNGKHAASRSRVHPLTPLLLLRLSSIARPWTTVAPVAAVEQFRASSDIQMTDVIGNLESQLTLAVQKEDYAEAARLRDELKTIRRENPIIALTSERQKRLNAELTTALSEEESLENRALALRSIIEMASPPMPAEGAEDALHRILIETTGDMQLLARSALRTVWDNSGDEDVNALYKKGLQCMEDGAFDSAVDIFTKVIAKAPEFAQGWNGRATSHFFLDECGRSLEDCEQVRKLKPRHFGCLTLTGTWYVRLGKFREALQYLKAAEELNPGEIKLKQAIALAEDLQHRSSVSFKMQSFLDLVGRVRATLTGKFENFRGKFVRVLQNSTVTRR
jgi:tetratricopeptide (TPR) repeat protein